MTTHRDEERFVLVIIAVMALMLIFIPADGEKAWWIPEETAPVTQIIPVPEPVEEPTYTIEEPIVIPIKGTEAPYRSAMPCEAAYDIEKRPISPSSITDEYFIAETEEEDESQANQEAEPVRETAVEEAGDQLGLRQPRTILDELKMDGHKDRPHKNIPHHEASMYSR